MHNLTGKTPRGVDELKEAARLLGVPKKALLVLDPKNDPFNVGTPATKRDAEWFSSIWSRFGYSSGVHLRRIHYKLVSLTDVEMPDGTTYTNTGRCWGFLVKACGHARDLGMIDPLLFDDRRNPAPRVNMRHTRDPFAGTEPTWEVWRGENPLSDYPGWLLPAIDPRDLNLFGFDTGRVEVDGYDYEPEDDPYQIEIWCEKSTMNDILSPLCHTLNANLQTGLGFLSEPRIFAMLERGKQMRKPVRIFYISDFDPAGSHMPTAVARNIEYYRDLIAPEVDFALTHIGMTKDWATRYNLPRSPIKEDDARKANFEKIHGEGCVELDALEALHPGALAREIRATLRPYLDLELERRLRATRAEAEQQANERWHESTAPIRGELGDIHREVSTIADQYRERLTELSEALREDLTEHRERLGELWDNLLELADPNADKPVVELPERPEGEAPGADESDWLYRSARPWRDQLARYRREKAAAGVIPEGWRP